MFRRLAHQTAVRLEALFDRLFNRTGQGREIDTYIGYATPDQIILRGRVLSGLRHSEPEAGQSRWRNVRQIFSMFLTDEVRDVTVRCDKVTATTDEEGYFTLALARDGRSGWSTEPLHVDGHTTPFNCPVFVPGPDAELMVISDIDDTMLDTGAYSLVRNLFTSFTGNAHTRQVFDDSKDLMDALSNDGRNPVFYVSSSPWNLHDFLADIFAQNDLVSGPMFLRDLGLSKTKFITDGHGNHKGASIDHILRANPDLPVVLLGDTGQHDAHIYRDVIATHPGRVIAVGLRTPGPGLDAADHHDLSALKDTGVMIYAGTDFKEFLKATKILQVQGS